MRILIVEDDTALGSFLRKGFQRDGHDVELATDGESGLACALSNPPDLLVLELSLPRMDGIEVLDRLKSRSAAISVLVLTGRNVVEERVRCLDLGADDCLMKPFALSELRARCRCLLRRREQFADPIVCFGGVELNRLERKVTCAGHGIELTTKEFALLEYLMQARGRVCSRTELLREVWHIAPDGGTNVVDVYVNYLRKKLAFASHWGTSHGQIETIRGAGYAMRQRSGKDMESQVPAGVLQAAMPDLSAGGFGRGGFVHA